MQRLSIFVVYAAALCRAAIAGSSPLPKAQEKLPIIRRHGGGKTFVQLDHQAVLHFEQAPQEEKQHDSNEDLQRYMNAAEEAKWAAIPNDEVRGMLEGWYQKYGADLEKVFARARSFPGHPQSDDLEISIHYLRLRDTKPEAVWECAPADGWSSFFILSAIKDNGIGRLYSFGLESKKKVLNYMSSCCEDLSALWSYREGRLEEVTKTYDFEKGKGGYKDGKGYVDVPPPQVVYMDALHTYAFGKMYADVLMSKLKGHVHLSMHDAFRDGWSKSGSKDKLFQAHPHRPMPEAMGVFDAIGSKICRGFTVSRSYDADFMKSVLAISDKYVKLPAISNFTLNPTFWFELGC